MKTLVIRADASTQIGTGHMMRCLALAQAWQAEGGHVVFLSHCENEAVRRHVVETEFDFIPLERPHPDPSDLQQTVAFLREVAAAWLVLDGYHFDPAYQRALREAGHCLLVIDDTAHWPEYHADILLNQNINATQLAYHCDPDTTLLLDTRYVLLRREFLIWRGWRREIPQVARKVLVTLGGGDPDNVTLKVIQALQQVNIPGLEARIVVGPANIYLETLRQVVKGSTCNMQLLTEVANMAELMAWPDLAISAGGSTCWELAFMGVPTVMVVLADNQRGIAEGLEQAGIMINLGWFNRVSNGEITDVVASLLNASGRRRQMSRSGQQLIDGNGPSRVIESLSVGCALLAE